MNRSARTLTIGLAATAAITGNILTGTANATTSTALPALTIACAPGAYDVALSTFPDANGTPNDLLTVSRSTRPLPVPLYNHARVTVTTPQGGQALPAPEYFRLAVGERTGVVMAPGSVGVVRLSEPAAVVRRGGTYRVTRWNTCDTVFRNTAITGVTGLGVTRPAGLSLARARDGVKFN